MKDSDIIKKLKNLREGDAIKIIGGCKNNLGIFDVIQKICINEDTNFKYSVLLKNNGLYTLDNIEKICYKHEMDISPREMTLNEAFLEALGLSEGRTCEIEEAEGDLYDYLLKYPDYIDIITDDYKFSVLKGWNYELVTNRH